MSELTRERFDEMIQSVRNGNEPPLWEEIAALRQRCVALENEREKLLHAKFGTKYAHPYLELMQRCEALEKELQEKDDSFVRTIGELEVQIATTDLERSQACTQRDFLQQQLAAAQAQMAKEAVAGREAEAQRDRLRSALVNIANIEHGADNLHDLCRAEDIARTALTREEL